MIVGGFEGWSALHLPEQVGVARHHGRLTVVAEEGLVVPPVGLAQPHAGGVALGGDILGSQ